MKQLLLLLIALPCFLISRGSGIENPTAGKVTPAKTVIPLNVLVKLSPREYEKLTGKKLKFKERIGLKILQWKAKRTADGKPTDKQKKLGWISLILATVGLICIFIPVGVIFVLGVGLAIAGLIIGAKSIKGNANAPGIIGVVIGSLALILLILAVIYVLAYGGLW